MNSCSRLPISKTEYQFDMFYTNKHLRISSQFWEYVLFFYEFVLFFLLKKDSCAALKAALPCNHTIQSASEASFSAESWTRIVLNKGLSFQHHYSRNKDKTQWYLYGLCLLIKHNVLKAFSTNVLHHNVFCTVLYSLCIEYLMMLKNVRMFMFTKYESMRLSPAP